MQYHGTLGHSDSRVFLADVTCAQQKCRTDGHSLFSYDNGLKLWLLAVHYRNLYNTHQMIILIVCTLQ
jgi:hypothetical protein